jgi:hypothetical protein
LAPFRRDALVFAAILLVVVAVGWSPGLPLGLAIGLWSYAVLFALITIVILASGYLGEDVKSLERILLHLEKLEFPREEELRGEEGRPSVWVIRVPHDEVGFLMNFTYSVGRVIRTAWQIVNQLLFWLILLYFLTVFPARIITENLDLEASWLEGTTTAFDRVATTMLLLATVVLMAMVVLRLSFAFDSLRWIARVDTWSEPTPWEGKLPELVSLDKDTRGLLRHTKVQGPSTTRIAELIRRSNLQVD